MQGLFLVSEEIYIRRVIVPRAPEKDEENYLRLWDIWKRRQVNIIEVDENDAEIDPSVVFVSSQSLEGIFKGQSK